MIPIRTLLRSFAQESRMKIIQIRVQAYFTETWLGMTTVNTVFARTSQAKHGLQLNKAMNMQCRSPEQIKSKGTTNSHTGNSTSTSLCTTSSPSFSSVCRRGGEGEGALWFLVLWFHVLWVATPRAKAKGLAWGGGAGGGGGLRRGDAAPYTYIYIYIESVRHYGPHIFQLKRCFL